MDFAHPDDRRMIADTLGRYIADRYDFEGRNRAAYGETGYSADHWSALAELGMTAALFDEASGGFGGTGFDIMVVFEALGRGLVVEPFLGALMAGRALSVAGGHEAALARIVLGEAIATFAHEDAGDATRATRDGDGWRIDGVKAVVAHAEAAALFLMSARTGDGPDAVSLFLIPAGTDGLSVRGYSNVDGGRSGDVTLAGVRAGADAKVGGEGAASDIIGQATGAGLLALSAEALGAMDAVRDMTLDYLRTRVQFGVPIGKFQALQHRMASVLIEIEQARSAVINAAAAFDGDNLARERVLSAAKYTVGRAGTLVAEEAIQMHGGIGMTWELPLSHYAKRLVMIDHQLGDEDHHLQRYIALGKAM